MAERTSNLALRLATAAVGVPIIVGLLYAAPPWAFYALVLVVSLVGVRELLGMTHPLDPVGRTVGIVVAAAASLAVYAWPHDPRVLLAVLTAVPVIGPLVTLVRLGALETAALRACALGFAPLFVALPLTLLGVLRATYGYAGSGAALLALGLAWFADTSAYFAGRFLGRHKLYEAVSPNKTIEGAIGGLFGSVAWALIASVSYLRGTLPALHAVPLGIAAGVLGQAGDLGESMLKRSTGIKDSGVIVPGHGGILDRVDAVIVTSVIVFLYAEWVWPR